MGSGCLRLDPENIFFFFATFLVFVIVFDIFEPSTALSTMIWKVKGLPSARATVCSLIKLKFSCLENRSSVLQWTGCWSVRYDEFAIFRDRGFSRRLNTSFISRSIEETIIWASNVHHGPITEVEVAHFIPFVLVVCCDGLTLYQIMIGIQRKALVLHVR